MRLTSLIVMMIVIAAMIGGQAIRSEEGEDFDIVSYADESLVWNSSIFSTNSTDPVVRVMRKISDTFGYVMFELGKYAMAFGFENPEYDFKSILDVIIIYFYLAVIGMMMPFIIPCLALGYVLIQKGKEIYDRRKNK